MDALWAKTATALCQGYTGGSFTPVDVLEATLARVEQVNPTLNALVIPSFDSARDAALSSALRYRQGRPRSPLDGVPITIKDNLYTKGTRTTWGGSPMFKDFVPDADETPVAKLRDCGAVIIGKTNAPELTVQGYTDNTVFGATGNPWNPALTPGGSSGGAVAAVASGMGPLALATDGGGSIRRPVAHTGLTGFKPSSGCVIRRVGFPKILMDFEVVGPIGRSVADLVLVMTQISDIVAPVSSHITGHAFTLAFAPRFGSHPVDQGIDKSVRSSVEEIRALGHSIKEISPFNLATEIDDVWPVVSQTGVAWLKGQFPDQSDQLSPAIALMAENGANLKAIDYLRALSLVETVRERFAELFETVDFIITPATAAQPWPKRQSHPSEINGQPVGPRGHAVFTAFVNALGLPAIALPCAPDIDGMPIGLQIVGPAGSDSKLLSFALALEESEVAKVTMPDFDGSITTQSGMT